MWWVGGPEADLGLSGGAFDLGKFMKGEALWKEYLKKYFTGGSTSNLPGVTSDIILSVLHVSSMFSASSRCLELDNDNDDVLFHFCCSFKQDCAGHFVFWKESNPTMNYIK